MMHLKTLLSILFITAMLCFTACGTQEQANPSADTSAQTQSTPAEDDAAPADPAPEGQQKSAANTPNLSVLSDSVQDLEQRLENLTPSGSGQEQKEQFLALKNEIDSLENEMEYAEESLESQYYDGSLEMAQYQEQERELDALEDRLDNCEDRLEFIFKMDD